MKYQDTLSALEIISEELGYTWDTLPEEKRTTVLMFANLLKKVERDIYNDVADGYEKKAETIRYNVSLAEQLNKVFPK